MHGWETRMLLKYYLEPTESVVRFETPAGRHYVESRVMLSFHRRREIGRAFSRVVATSHFT